MVAVVALVIVTTIVAAVVEYLWLVVEWATESASFRLISVVQQRWHRINSAWKEWE